MPSAYGFESLRSHGKKSVVGDNYGLFSCQLRASRYRTPLSLRDISLGRMELSDIWEFYFGGAGSQSLVCLFKRLFCILDYIGIC